MGMDKMRQLLYELKSGIPTDVRLSRSLDVDLMTAHKIRTLYEEHVREARSRGYKPISSLNDYVRLLVQKNIIRDESVYNVNELVEKGKKIQRVHGKLLGIVPSVKQYD